MFLKVIFILWFVLLSHNVLAIDNVITIDQSGSDIPQCCFDGECLCSSLSLALTHIQDDTEIIITSDIPLHDDVQFGNVSSIIITGHSNPTVMCDHQGGVVGKNVKHITIKNITWDKCNGIEVYGPDLANINAYIITDCTFQYSTSFSLKLSTYGPIHINGTSFSHNIGGVSAAAPYIIVYNSNFYDTIKSEALHFYSVLTFDVTIISVNIVNCSFSHNSGYSVMYSGGYLHANLLIISSAFTNNTDSTIYGSLANITLLHNVLFYNNVVVGTSDGSADGAAIRLYDSTLNIAGTVAFCNNKAGNNGGAVYLSSSPMYLFTDRSVVTFSKNQAGNKGGAIYIDAGSDFHSKNTILEFENNNAISLGGAFYVKIFDQDSPDMVNRTFNYYYEMLNSRNKFVNNTVGVSMINNVYFEMYFYPCNRMLVWFKEKTFSSAVCGFLPYKSKIGVDSSNFTCSTTRCQVGILPQDVYLRPQNVDHFHNAVAPTNISCSFSFNFGHSENYNCTIDGNGTFTVLSNDTVVTCPLNPDNTVNITFTAIGTNYSGSYDMKVAAYWNMQSENCDDIAHVASPDNGCMPLSCDLLYYLSTIPKGVMCLLDQYVADAYSNVAGYWFSNGFKQYVSSCPDGLCNNNFDLQISVKEELPDSNSQCHQHWTGLSCGRCYSNFTIQYDTTNCINSYQCFQHSSVLPNLLLLLVVSLLYWCLIISFIFVLLHFRFDVTAGYAYAVIFYYSVLESFVNMISSIVHSAEYGDRRDSYVQMVSFLSIIGYIKSPFLRYLSLCMHHSEIMDHVFLSYIHPLIVISLITLIFIAARRSVTVARYIGRYVNSKSICLLLLLSYSSVCYTSMQILKPLVVQSNFNDTMKWHTYLSPAVQYFHGRHILYGIIAILCELIIGIGLPLVILTQRYLIRYFDLKLISIKPVIDQLQGCYKEEYRWFAAYYLICRQVVYTTNIITQFIVLIVDPSIVILMLCISILVIHLWFQPYKKRSLNFFDAFVLLVLILVVCCGFYESGLNSGAVVGLSILPALCLINYLGISSKLKHILIPCSCGGMICIAVFQFYGIFKVFIIFLSSLAFLIYLAFVIKLLYVKLLMKNSKLQYVMINVDVDVSNSSDDEMP